MSRTANSVNLPIRHKLVLAFMFGTFGLLGVRAVFLQVINAEYLQEQGNARHLRIVEDSERGGHDAAA